MLPPITCTARAREVEVVELLWELMSFILLATVLSQEARRLPVGQQAYWYRITRKDGYVRSISCGRGWRILRDRGRDRSCAGRGNKRDISDRMVWSYLIICVAVSNQNTHHGVKNTNSSWHIIKTGGTTSGFFSFRCWLWDLLWMMAACICMQSVCSSVEKMQTAHQLQDQNITNEALSHGCCSGTLYKHAPKDVMKRKELIKGEGKRCEALAVFWKFPVSPWHLKA